MPAWLGYGKVRAGFATPCMVDDCPFALGEAPSEAEFGDASSDEDALAAFRGAGGPKHPRFEEEVGRHLHGAHDGPTSSRPPAARRSTASGRVTGGVTGSRPAMLLEVLSNIFLLSPLVGARQRHGCRQKLVALRVRAHVL